MKEDVFANKYIYLFDCCKITQGSSRSIIVDLQRKKYFFIPNALASLFQDNNTLFFNDLLKKHPAEKDIILEYLYFLNQNELIYLSNITMYDSLVSSSSHIKDPFAITNAIIDYRDSSNYSLEKAVQSVVKLGVPNVQFRFFCNLSFPLMEKFLQVLNTSCIRNVEIIAQYSEDFTNEEVEKIVNFYQSILMFVFYKSPFEEVSQHKSKSYGFTVYTMQDLSSSSHCGNVSPSYFAPNSKMYYESLENNSCLNKKISIDIKGNIKNCPSMIENFGNINNTTLNEALNKKGFKKYWNISKSKISVCKDCEFRNVCTDCRAYIENPDDIYSKPLKCGYNPYTNEWEDWSKNPLKEETIKFYQL